MKRKKRLSSLWLTLSHITLRVSYTTFSSIFSIFTIPQKPPSRESRTIQPGQVLERSKSCCEVLNYWDVVNCCLCCALTKLIELFQNPNIITDVILPILMTCPVVSYQGDILKPTRRLHSIRKLNPLTLSPIEQLPGAMLSNWCNLFEIFSTLMILVIHILAMMQGDTLNLWESVSHIIRTRLSQLVYSLYGMRLYTSYTL